MPKLCVPVSVEAECPEAKRGQARRARESVGRFDVKNILLTVETVVVVSKDPWGGPASGVLGTDQANVVSGPHGLPSQCRAVQGVLGAVADVPREESVPAMRLRDQVVGPAGQPSAGKGGLSPSTYRRPGPVSKYRTFFSSRTCLSLRHLFITSPDM